MESSTLLNNQAMLMENMNKVLINFKKDGPERRTAKNIRKKLDDLETYWKEFELTHQQLCQFEDQSHEYFTGNNFEKTREFYLNTKDYLLNCMSQESKVATPIIKQASFQYKGLEIPSPSGASVDTRPPIMQENTRSGTPTFPDLPRSGKKDELVRKQKSNFKAFSRTVSNINLDVINEKWEFEDTLKALQARWTAIDSLHWEIDSEIGVFSDDYEQMFNYYEQQFLKIKKEINTKMWSVSHREKSTPKVEIPTFSGSYQTWISFKDLFTETIHSNPSLSSAQKMQFLKSKVKGEAEKLIQHLSISSDNYNVAWEILNHRYNNKKLIFTSHINTLLNLPSMQHQSSLSIKKIHDTTNECLNAIKNLGADISTWDPILVHILSQKLDVDSHNDYIESMKTPRELPILSEFMDFLELKFTSLESSRRKTDTTARSPSQQQNETSKKSHSYKAYSTNQNLNTYNKSAIAKTFNKNATSKCLLCQGGHRLFHCDTFLQLHPDAKRKTVVKYNLCKNCLYDHKGKECISEKRCQTCNDDHNTLLHYAYAKSSPISNKSNGASSSKPPNSTNHVSQEDLSETLLATALVRVTSHDGQLITLRALIDQGSQTSLISEKAAQLLKLPRNRCKGVIFGVGAKENNCKGLMNITCSAINGDYTLNTSVYIMRQLINNLPNKSFPRPSWTYLKDIKLADPEFYKSRPVDLLLGADVYSNIIQEGIIRQGRTQPVAQQTHLGWILCGKTQTLQCNVVLNNTEDLQRFWTIEDISEIPNMTEDDQQCLQYYQDTTERRDDGRYVVCMPFQENFEEKLGASRPIAAAQFHHLERKFTREQNLAEAYKRFMQEYESLDHMVEVISNKLPHYYLPHHGVERVESTTTAYRVVFNASQPTSSGRSLNDVMRRGPNLQQDLMSLILKWRQYPCAFTADIEKMYRQIRISDHHQKYQKVLWRNSPNEKLREYQLTTVTYGTKAAPFLAMMTLRQLAKDEGHKYLSSRAPKALQEEFYMDDLVSGTFTLQQGKQLQTDLIDLLQSGGFNLRKWSSNRYELLEGVQTAHHQDESFDFNQSESTKTLGLRWQPYQDQFSFQLNINAKKMNKLTKRELLSDISKIFDPLGWLSPVTTKLKLLFKQVWQSKVQWDDPLSADIITEWEKIKNDLRIINEFKINRWYRSSENDTIELHGFSDASLQSYACVVFCKIKVNTVLVAAKTRLTPANKRLTMPRLELCGAHLLAKLMDKVKKGLSGHSIKTFGWSDSTAVLGWIQGDAARWKPFVANRVRQIIEIMPSESWRYVKSSENPADCASRGLSAAQLQNHRLWWEGPEFLATFNEQNETRSTYVTNDEIKISKQSYAIQRQNTDDIVHQLLHKHSNLTRLIRVLAWVFRAITRHRVTSAYLTLSELRRAKGVIIKYVQVAEFSDEIETLKSKHQINSKSKILNFNPFLDKDGILRVGGRIKNAHIHDNMKHPIIIAHSGQFTNLIIDHAHKLTFHGGARLTLSNTRQQYWIMGGNRAVKKRLLTCSTCKKRRSTPLHQIMGDLPESRINPSRPFQHTGVDYTGYIDIKLNKGRGVKTTKGYIAVFVCMVTKAIHLELVSDLSASAFLAALKRMSCHHAKPQHIYSDNGSNFVGADRLLQKELSELLQISNKEFFTEINEMEIQWHRICPAWPSAGGLWERAVRSLKHHLRRVVGEQKLTYEEFTTLLAQLEGCLNSRPLCAITEDPNDLDYLTPAHFLSGGPVLTIIDTEKDVRTRWHMTQKIFQDIWKKWKAEYLCELSSRSKWKQPQANIEIDDVVVIHDDNIPAGKWPLGRVTDVHPGSDGKVRVVTLKTKGGIIQRPVIKLSVLPTKSTETEQIPTKNIDLTQPVKPKPIKKGKRQSSNFISMAMSFILFMTLIAGGQCSYNVTPVTKALFFDKVSSMQFVHDEWKLVVYYDMSPYWDGSETLNKYIKQLDVICNRTRTKTLCDIIALQLRHSQEELEYYNRILLGQQLNGQVRARRGLINGVGYVAHSLFGVLDERFANQYQMDITLIRDNEKHLAMLWQNQTSVVEAEYNLLKRTEEAINKQHKIINQHLNHLANAISKEAEQSAILNEFALSTIIANNMLNKLKTIQDSLLDIITDLHHGMFNLHLISPQQFRDELNIISGQLPRELSLPIQNIQTDIIKIYHLLKTKARITEKYLICEIRIPLITRDTFDLYRAIAIPYQSGNNTISVIPIADYIAINLHKDTYLSLSETDIEQCVQYDDSSRLCKSKKPIYHLRSDQDLCVKNQDKNICETNIVACKNSWTELNTGNAYLFFCCGHCSLRIICAAHITSVQVEKAGVIALHQNCVIKGESFTVYSHKTYQNEMKSSLNLYLPDVIAPINNLVNITIPSTEINISDFQSQTSLHRIKEQIDQMKSEKALNEGISYHDIHQYAIIYVVLSCVATAAAVYGWRRWQRGRTGAAALTVPARATNNFSNPRSRGHSSKQTQESIEMKGNYALPMKVKKKTVFRPPVFHESDQYN